MMVFVFVTKRIPKNIMHKVPTTLLHSLEGMPDLEWEKLLKLQCKDGSFLFSPSSTAFALMQTQDEKCLQYLTNTVTKFNGGGMYVLSWWFMPPLFNTKGSATFFFNSGVLSNSCLLMIMF